jgi:HEAT repeat protein
MVRPTRETGPALALLLVLAAPLGAQAPAPGDPAAKTVRDFLARFDEGDPGWKVRMEALVGLAKVGPAAVPVLVEALQKGLPLAREFAAQALVLCGEPGTRPALEQALGDPKSGVRMYALLALSMLGRLERTERYERLLKSDPSNWGVRPLLAAALEREDQRNPAELRQALADYDLRSLDSARVGETAPDFALTDFTGMTVRLSQFRGQTVVLRFILFDF